MLGIGWTEFVLIALVLLIFVGPRHLPGLLRKAGQIVGEFKAASRELRDQVAEEVRDIENAVGKIDTPGKIARDVAKDLTSDFTSPYEEARRAGEEIEEEVKGGDEKDPGEKPS